MNLDLFRLPAQAAAGQRDYGHLLRLPGRLFNRPRPLPVLMQSRHSDCGFVCLAMVAAAFGRHVEHDWLGLRRHCTERGMTVSALLDAATSLGLQGRALRLEPAELRQLQLPAILHWDMDHFVVLQDCRRRHVVVHDPAAGRREYRYPELNCHFTGIAIEVTPTVEFVCNQAPKLPALRDLLGPGHGLHRPAVLLFVLSLLIQMISLVTPFYVQLAIDHGLASRDPGLLILVTSLFLFLVLLKTALAYWRGSVLMGLSSRVSLGMNSNVFSHLLRLPEQYFAGRNMGDVVSRFGSLENIRRLLTGESVAALVDGVFSLATLALLFVFSPTLALLSATVVLISAVLRLLVVNGERTMKQEVVHLEAAQRSRFMENLRAIRTIKLFRLARLRSRQWINRQAEVTNSALQLDRFRNRATALQNLIYGLDQVLTIYLGARFIYLDQMSVGQLLGFVFLKQHFIASVSAMVPRLVELKMMRLDLERLGDILHQAPEPDHEGLPLLAGTGSGTLSARGLGFTYPGTEVMVLCNLDFTLDRSQVLGISGPSGGGKTTLVRLICGLLQPVAGQLLVNGGPQRRPQVDKQGRSGLAAVLDDDELLTGSLLYNISLDLDSGNRERLLLACSTACILDEILQLPMQFATRAGEWGCSLSAGQIKRILLARALYREPAILVLDETLSSLELPLAIRILEQLRSRRITVVLVTHSRTLLEHADRHLELEPRKEIAEIANDAI